MEMIVTMLVTMFIAFSSMLVAAVNRCLPNALENKLALRKSYFSSHNRVVFFELFNYFILLVRRQFSKLLENFALVLTLQCQFLVASPLALGSLLTVVIVIVRL